MTTIVGAGLAGLIAAHAFPQWRVVEAAKEPAAAHRALLRFRSDAVARLTGIDFHKVLVRKSIWSDGDHTTPNIRLANMYASKVLGVVVGDRSVWNLDPVERWIAPDNLYEQLVDAVGNRITWGVEFDFALRSSMHGIVPVEPVVSTAPLPVVLRALKIEADLSFDRAPIHVRRFRLEGGGSLYQTIYFPDRNTPLYRASITGDTLIAELAVNPAFAQGPAIEDTDHLVLLVREAFGLQAQALTPLESVRQHYGKIASVDNERRKRLLYRLTRDHGIYSLGRFATWRNILLDDVVDDIAGIKRLFRINSAYDLARASAGD